MPRNYFGVTGLRGVGIRGAIAGTLRDLWWYRERGLTARGTSVRM